MSEDGSTVRVLSAGRRVGAASSRGCTVAVEYVVEGEPGTEMDWLDDFLDEHAEGVEVGDDGLRADGGSPADGPDRWKCPDCGSIVVDPGAPIATCSCGSDRVQIREWPGNDDFSPPEWPDDSDYSPDPRDVETEIEYEPWRQSRAGGGDER